MAVEDNMCQMSANMNKIPQNSKGALLYSPVGSIVRPAELHSRSAEENRPTENVSSLCSVKVAPPLCAAYAAIPCVLAVRKQHEMLFAASKFEGEKKEFMKQTNRNLSGMEVNTK